MSTKQDVVSEARAHLKRLDDAAEEARRVRYEHPAVAMRACSERNAARMLLDEAAPALVRGLLAVVDEQRARLDALAPLEQAAATYASAYRAWDAAADEAKREWATRHNAGSVWADASARELKAAGALLRSDDALRTAARGER